jgi:hypothetical protein
MEADLSNSESVFANSLLKLTARGSEIITEIQRLSHNIPKVSSAITQSLSYPNQVNTKSIKLSYSISPTSINKTHMKHTFKNTLKFLH